MVEYPHHTVEQTKVSTLKSRYSIKFEKPFGFDMEEKYLSRLEREFSIQAEGTRIHAEMTFPAGTGRCQRWFGRPHLAGDIVRENAPIGHSQLDRSKLDFTMEIHDRSGSVVWRCRPLSPRTPGTSIVIANSKDEEQGRVFGDNEISFSFAAFFGKRWDSGVISADLADRALAFDTDFALFLVAFTISNRLIASDIHGGSGSS